MSTPRHKVAEAYVTRVDELQRALEDVRSAINAYLDGHGHHEEALKGALMIIDKALGKP